MTPSEFTKLLRERVHSELGRLVTPLREDMTCGQGIDPTGLDRFMSNPGAALARRQLIPAEAASRANRVLYAMYRSPAFRDYMQRATAALEADSRFLNAVKAMTMGSDTLRAEDALEALRRIVDDDTLITGPLQLMHSDPEIKAALEIPAGETFDTYIQRIRKTIRDATTLDEVLSVARCGEEITPAFCTATICVAIVSIVSLAAVVHTAMGAVNYAFVYVVAANTVFAKWVLAVTASGLPDSPERLSLAQAGPLTSTVVNGLTYPVWIVVQHGPFIKRVPLLPTVSSEALGLMTIRAVLMGGQGNSLVELNTRLDGTRTTGAYVLSEVVRRGKPATVLLRDINGVASAEANEVQVQAENERRAGYTDLAGGGSAGKNFDPRFCMHRIAATFPAAFDLNHTMQETCDAAHFYHALRVSRISEFSHRSRHERS